VDALQESQAKLEAALSSTSDAVFVSDAEGRFIDFNDAFATFHRFKNREECSQTFAEYPDILDVFLPDGTLAPLDMWAVPRALRGETATNAEYTLRRKDTGETWIGSYSFGPIRDQNGTIVGSVVVGRDITERRQDEQALRESEGRLERAQKLAHLGSWELDVATRKLIWSDEVYRIFGVPPEEFGGTLDEFFEWVHPDDRGPVDAAYYSSVRENRDTYEIEHRIIHQSSGEIRVVDEKCEHVRDASGEIVRSIGMVHDITERKQAEQKIHRHNAVMGAVNLILKATLSAATEEELGEACLGVVEEITGSKFGFIGEIGADGILHDVAISNLGRDACRMSDLSGHRQALASLQAHGIYGRALLDGKGFFSNDLDSRPDEINAPSEHPPITSFLGAPLSRDQETIGMVAVANREGGYGEEHVEALEMLAPVIVEAFLHKRAEAEAEEGKRILDALMESVPEGISIATAPDGKIRMTSHHGQEVLGGSPVGLTAGQVITQWKAYRPDGITPMAAADLPVVRAIKQGETLRDVELVQINNAGQRLLLSCNAAPFRDREGKITGGVVAWRDLSELKEAERRHSRILASALSGFSVTDMQGRFLEVNDALCRMLGYSRSELFTMHVTDIEASDDWAAVQQRITALEENGFDHFETRHRHKDGTLIDVEVNATFHQTGGGQVASFIQDIRTRKQAEEALHRTHDELERRVRERTTELQQSEERFRQLAENIQEVFWLLEPDTWQVLYVSPAFDVMWGRSAQEFAEQPESFLDTIYPDDREQVLHDLTANWQAYDGEFRIVRPDGTLRWIRLRSFPVHNEQGEVYRVAGVAVDRTEQRATETALIQAEQLAIAGKLAASVAHEINNPLQSVIGCLGLLQGALESDKDPAIFLQVARQEVKRTAQIVSQLRSLGQPIQNGYKEPTDLNGLLNDVLVLNKKHLQTHKIEAIWEPDAGLPLLPLIPDAMRQVFLNLVINAADAMPEGGQLRLSTEYTESPAGVRVVVADTGAGIPPDVLPHIFDAFYSTKAEGLGVGLFVSQTIVQQHGGGIEVESEPGVGTTFTVWLPS
jgi:PAS domain S-box-containing protein